MKNYMFANYHSDNEMIEAVAIQYSDGRIETLDRPNRHHHIIKKVYYETGEKCTSHLCIQGFITNTGRFVSRAEARLIAIDSGQVNPEDTLHRVELFSEDLW